MKQLLDRAAPHLVIALGILAVLIAQDMAHAAFVLAIVVYLRQK
jgi:hypothetical protein